MDNRIQQQVKLSVRVPVRIVRAESLDKIALAYRDAQRDMRRAGLVS